MKYVYVCVFFLMSVFFHTSCGQNQTNVPQDNIKSKRANYSESQLKEAETTKVPMGMVRHVRQARNGDILIASFLSVFRYDGTSFTNLTGKIISPRFSSFWDVLEDRKGNLWFASVGSGVYKYDGKTFQHFTTREGLASDVVQSIYEDRAGNIWFGASRYDGNSFRNFTIKDGFPSNNIRLLLEDNTGKLWFGAQGEEMFVYDGKTFTVLKNEDGKAFTNVWSIIEDKKGNIWFGGNGYDLSGYGLWRYDGSTFTKVSQRGAYAIIEDKKGNIWTTGEVNPNAKVWALSRYDAKSLYDRMPTVTEIRSGGRMGFLGILEANDGSIWYGSGDGVHRYDGKTFTDFRSKAGQ
ncbi:two-component regulator propeller domain-containing protein [Flavitalea sp. BT771]|uniref:ligand-binding sensor domain-containing protein n=1 Tax=Flavitalea sp. BT771 TaxID=3063329 RepID=UPI0026E35A79|nr:two-component regulator propeller domain-containing protein [Flavitalea sp. BT771]MDO6429416.1 two-component regulator propeller domain-containing protein [Flavitalea sp. BT771]MDV6218456.1 two-component regulator propeller domain-containing protein [Flavitalea sp. BT771]